MATVLRPCPRKAAATETRLRICEKETISAIKKPDGSSRSVRIHGNLIVSRRTRRIGPGSSSVDVTHKVEVVLDHRADDVSPASFACIENCSNLIHDMLAKAPATREYDLAAGNWVDSTRTLFDVATAIVQHVGHEFDDVPADLQVDVHLAELRVSLAYSEPKALLLACKAAASTETEAAGALARGRKRRREPAGEPCPICFLETAEETVRLPCSHFFHCRCIETWFHRASTCPTCRCDTMKCFPSVRAASPKQFTRVGDSWFDDENEMVTVWNIEPEVEVANEIATLWD